MGLEVHVVLDVPAELHRAMGSFWSGALGWAVGESWPGQSELASFEPPEGSSYVHLQRIEGPPRVHLDLVVGGAAAEFAGKWHRDGSPVQLLFQRLDEPGVVVRAHLDLGTDDVTAEVRRLLDEGAVDLGPGRGWHVLRDAAGLPFCVTGNSPAGVHGRDLD